MSRYIMAQAEAVPGCVGTCPHFEPVQGSCEHELRQVLTSYLQEHADAPCPMYEEVRAEEMRSLADRLEQQH